MASVPATVFHFDEGRPGFEDLGKENGATHWDEAVLMEVLGYQTGQGFTRALTRAKQACLSLGIQCEDHFIRKSDGTHIITRFGCYLVAMNGDPRKPEVAAAHAYFAAIAETFQNRLEHTEAIDRVLIRDEVTDGQKALMATAKAHGVENYAFFQNKGYMGMYNMPLQRLKEYKGIAAKENPLDRMGRAELAANLFRITQTEQKISKENIKGQSRLEATAFHVGREVRDTMQRVSNTTPEELPTAEDIKQVRRKLKGTQKQLKNDPRPDSGG